MTRAAIRIRRYTDADWSTVCLIHDRAQPYELEFYVPRDAILPMEEEAEADGFFHAQTFLAETGNPGRVVGFVCIDPPELTWLYVDPDVHRQGVARCLVQYVLPQLGPDAFVLCMGENRRALSAYGSFGFTIAARFPGEIDGVSCECVWLCLPGNQYCDQPPEPRLSALILAGYSAEYPGQAVRGSDGVWHWGPASNESGG